MGHPPGRVVDRTNPRRGEPVQRQGHRARPLRWTWDEQGWAALQRRSSGRPLGWVTCPRCRLAWVPEACERLGASPLKVQILRVELAAQPFDREQPVMTPPLLGKNESTRAADPQIEATGPEEVASDRM